MAEFRIKILAVWLRDGQFEILETSESSTDDS